MHRCRWTGHHVAFENGMLDLGRDLLTPTVPTAVCAILLHSHLRAPSIASSIRGALHATESG